MNRAHAAVPVCCVHVVHSGDRVATSGVDADSGPTGIRRQHVHITHARLNVLKLSGISPIELKNRWGDSKKMKNRSITTGKGNSLHTVLHLPAKHKKWRDELLLFQFQLDPAKDAGGDAHESVCVPGHMVIEDELFEVVLGIAICKSSCIDLSLQGHWKYR